MAFLRACLVALVALLGLTSALVPLLDQGNEIIQGSWIVVFQPQVSFGIVRTMAAEFSAKHTLHIGSFKAFGGDLSDEAVAKLRTRTDIIKYIEADKIVRSLYATQLNATWGLDRIDQVTLPLNTQYRYFESAGQGVDAYIIDTGILLTHEDFEGRAVSGYDFHNNREDATDDNGHGTHVASTVAGKVYGVAKKAKLVAVKTLGRFGAGNLLNVAKGVEFAAQQHNSSPGRKSVANMSLGGPATQSLDDAVAAAIEAGLVVVAASGNSNEDACNTSPARVPTAITVNAANINDARASFSNFGVCTHIFAPGQDITAAWIGSDSTYRTISGTSMACPHVVGAAVALLGETGVLTPAEVKKTLLDRASAGLISDVQGSPNLLLFSRYQ